MLNLVEWDIFNEFLNVDHTLAHFFVIFPYIKFFRFSIIIFNGKYFKIYFISCVSSINFILVNKNGT